MCEGGSDKIYISLSNIVKLTMKTCRNLSDCAAAGSLGNDWTLHLSRLEHFCGVIRRFSLRTGEVEIWQRVFILFVAMSRLYLYHSAQDCDWSGLRLSESRSQMGAPGRWCRHHCPPLVPSDFPERKIYFSDNLIGEYWKYCQHQEYAFSKLSVVTVSVKSYCGGWTSIFLGFCAGTFFYLNFLHFPKINQADFL